MCKRTTEPMLSLLPLSLALSAQHIMTYNTHSPYAFLPFITQENVRDQALSPNYWDRSSRKDIIVLEDIQLPTDMASTRMYLPPSGQPVAAATQGVPMTSVRDTRGQEYLVPIME